MFNIASLTNQYLITHHNFGVDLLVYKTNQLFRLVLCAKYNQHNYKIPKTLYLNKSLLQLFIILPMADSRAPQIVKRTRFDQLLLRYISNKYKYDINKFYKIMANTACRQYCCKISSCNMYKNTHRRSHIYFVYFIHTRTLRQRCHANRCKNMASFHINLGKCVH